MTGSSAKRSLFDEGPAIDSSTHSAKSPMPHGFVLLRLLLTICATYLVLTHCIPSQSTVPMAIFLLGAATVTAALLTVPARHLESRWLVSGLLIVDTAGLAALVLFSEALSPQLLFLFLLTILMAAISTSRRQIAAGSAVVVALHWIGASSIEGAAVGSLDTVARLAFLCAACAFYRHLIGGVPRGGLRRSAEPAPPPRRRRIASARPLQARKPVILNPNVAVLGLCRRYWDVA